jgi:hypothetical protein
LDGGTNDVLTLPNIPAEDTYQDSGEYVCIAGMVYYADMAI